MEASGEAMMLDDAAAQPPTTPPPPPTLVVDVSDAASAAAAAAPEFEARSVQIPAHRYTPLRAQWAQIYPLLVEQLRLQVRVNTTKRAVELRIAPVGADAAAAAAAAAAATLQPLDPVAALQRGADFVHAFVLGFAVEDAAALLRLDDLYVESFCVDDVKQSLHGDHLARAVGRLAGKDGRTKRAIENVTRTRIVLADRHVHILGTFAGIHMARDAVCDLVLGAPPGKVYAKLQNISARAKERF